jgi:pyruvate dehydrogenase E1 component
MPEGVREGILKGIYRLKRSEISADKGKVNLFGSGPLMNETLKAQKLLQEKFGIAADVWSVTSYKELRRDGIEADRWNLLNPGERPRVPYIQKALEGEEGTVFVASSDYVKALPDSIARWIPGTLNSLGTDGFGRSDSRSTLRDFFEVDHRYIVLAALNGLARQNKIGFDTVQKAIAEFGVNPEKKNPVTS